MRAIINILYILSYFILMITILVTFSLPAFSITAQEKRILKTHIEDICNYYNQPCKITYLDTRQIQGYTMQDGEIILTRGLTDRLTYNQTKAVALHELGHHILRHYKRTDIFFKSWNLNQNELKMFRYKLETEADLFATSYYILSKQYNYLPEALIVIAGKQGDENSSTHPSVQKRISNINNYTKEYYEKNNNSSYSRKLYTK